MLHSKSDNSRRRKINDLQSNSDACLALAAIRGIPEKKDFAFIIKESVQYPERPSKIRKFLTQKSTLKFTVKVSLYLYMI